MLYPLVTTASTQWRKGFALLSRQVFDLQISSCADKFKDF
jgi:hypothetical protein